MNDVEKQEALDAYAKNGVDQLYMREAFKRPFNLTFLAMVLVASVTTILLGGGETVFPFIVIAAMVAEVSYVMIMSRQERFRKAVRARKLAGRRRDPSQKEVYRQLSRRSQRRYARLRQLEDAIEANYEKLSSASQSLLQSHLQKIDGLLEAHLNMLYRHERYLDYNEAETESEVRRSIAAVRERLEEASPRVRKVKERRLRILKQRLRRFREGHENREVVEAQLQTIEDVVRYIHEQSWTLQDPEEITQQLDLLLDEVEDTQHSIQAVEDVYTRSPDDLLDELQQDELDDAERSPRSRQRN